MTKLKTATLAVAAVLGLLATAASAAPAPLMTVLIKPGRVDVAKQTGQVDVVMTVPAFSAAAGQPLFSLSTTMPGTAYPQKVGEVTATDDHGAVPLADAPIERALNAETKGDRAWKSSRPVRGVLTVRYRLPVENIPMLSGGPPLALRIDGDGMSSVGGVLLMSPSVTVPYRVALKWDVSAMGPGAEGVSSFGDGDVTIAAGPVARLQDSLFMAGHLQRTPAKGSKAAFSAVWLGDPGFDARETMTWTGQLHGWMSRYFRDKVEPPYRVFMRFNPMNAPGGAAFPNSFIVTYGNGVTAPFLKSILGHEMTHTWTATDSIGKWYDEGNAVYYQALLAWRADMITTDAYLHDLNETASRYYTNARYDVPELEAERRFWEDTRIRVLPYDRGAMYFAVLDGQVRKASGGKRSIDDLIHAMIAKARAGEPMTEQVWLDMLRAETGEAGLATHRAMMVGAWMLPESDGFGPCFRRTTKPIRRFDFGFDFKSVVGPERVIRGLIPGSEADKAGLRNGDRIAYGISVDVLQADVNRTFTVQVTRDGKTFPVTYLPRGEAVDAYQWERIPGVPESACKP